MASLQDADAAFTTTAPLLPLSKPALLLPLAPLGTFGLTIAAGAPPAQQRQTMKNAYLQLLEITSSPAIDSESPSPS
jgi:hypothetical protein